MSEHVPMDVSENISSQSGLLWVSEPSGHEMVIRHVELHSYSSDNIAMVYIRVN